MFGRHHRDGCVAAIHLAGGGERPCGGHSPRSAQAAAGVPLVIVEQTPAGPAVTVAPVDTPEQAGDVAEAAAADGNLLSVEVDSPVFALDHAPADDARRAEQWALDRLLFEHAAANAAGGGGQVVAVIDTGVKADHEDLAGQVLPGRNIFANPDNGNTNDNNGHGTHVAGIVAALDNTVGIIGAAPAADILPVKVLGANGSGGNSDVANGIKWAVDNGADVINLSLGGTYSQAVDQQVTYARQQGVVVIASAGNEGQSPNPSYPGALPLATGVASTEPADTIASHSLKNACVDISAPGSSILSTVPFGNGTPACPDAALYCNKSGTSMAAPHVAAEMALILAAHPEWDLNPAAACNQLIRTAQDLGAAGRDNAFGHGLIQPHLAVGAQDTSGPTCT